jgi:hypothetical protein
MPAAMKRAPVSFEILIVMQVPGHSGRSLPPVAGAGDSTDYSCVITGDYRNSGFFRKDNSRVIHNRREGFRGIIFTISNKINGQTHYRG